MSVTSQPQPLTAESHSELQQFLNLAFGHPADRDREQFMPGACPPTDEAMAHQYAILDRGRIVAAAGLFPIQWRVGQTTLPIACIGNVGVDAAYRNQGLMQTLMRRMVQQARDEHYPLALLGGQRQRYQYFGWERAGVWIQFTVTRNNLRHSHALQSAPPVSLEPLGNDPQVIAALARLHDAQPMHCERPLPQFANWLRRWGHRPQVARDADGRVAGYVVIKEAASHATELRARDMPTALAIVRAVVEQHPAGSATFQFEPDGHPLLHALGDVAEAMQLNSAGNWQIFDWPKVIAALLAARHAASPLPQGAVTLGLPSQRALRLYVEPGQVGCEPVSHMPDLTVADALLLTRLLFGPLPPSMVLPLPPAAAILDAWCPLPLSIPHQDRY